MTLYDLTKKYGEGKGENMMWKSLRIVSDAVENGMDEESKSELMRKIYNTIADGHYNEEYALADVAQMFYNDNAGDQHYAPYWTVPQVKEVYESVKGKIPTSYNFWDFYVALQMQKSDLYPLLSRWFPDDTPEQMDKRLVEATLNWLTDDDNPFGDKKVWGYVNANK